MDELEIEGKTYLSSKRAASVTGYAKDYIGQLCREGRVEARLVGRSWYVYEPSLEKHKAEKASEMRSMDEEPQEPESLDAEHTEATEDTWQPASYESEPVAELPLHDEKTIEEIENSWKEWFVAGQETVVEPDSPLEVSKPHVEEEVPIQITRLPYEEIRPIEEVMAIREERAAPIKLKEASKATYQPKKSYRILQAAMVAVMVLSVAVTALSLDIQGVMSSETTDGVSVVNYIKGIDSIKINNK